ncbi:MAG: YicC family protein [Clostridia bacterium]|nr:YicC family protein [Clostridia bacterium]
MAYSMTGFGRSEKIFATRRYTVELKSVNSRYCDINVRLPRLFNFAESAIRKLVSDQLSRGKVDIYISYEDQESASAEVTVNTGLARAYSEAIKKLAEETGRPDDLSATRLSSYQDVLVVRQANVDEDTLMRELTEVCKEAIDGMLQMRKIEGDNLCADLLQKVSFLEATRNEIAERAPQVVADYRERLSNRIDEILDSEKRALYDDARLAAEVAVFADKAAIDEELSRLISHFAQARTILSSNGAIGKKMDFLVQEINREVNTIGSKANDLEITNRVLLMKNEIEKIREQIQNLV